MSTFDPKEYDKTNSSAPKSEKFSDKRTRLIKYISDYRPLIVKECQMLKDYIEKNPTGTAVGPFNEKLDGWSRILNGIDILKAKYEIV